MTYLYDGKRLVGIECSTWDREKQCRTQSESEDFGILRPDFELLPILSPADPVPSGYVYTVCDAQFYIDRAELWEKYEQDSDDPEFDCREQYEGEAERYERSAYWEELDVAEFEAEHKEQEAVDAEFNPDPKDRKYTIAEAKAAIAANG